MILEAAPACARKVYPADIVGTSISRYIFADMLVTGKHILLSDAEPDGGTAHAFIVTDPAVVLEKRTRPFLRIVLLGTGGTVYKTSGEALFIGFGANNCRNVIAIYIPK